MTCRFSALGEVEVAGDGLSGAPQPVLNASSSHAPQMPGSTLASSRNGPVGSCGPVRDGPEVVHAAADGVARAPAPRAIAARSASGNCRDADVLADRPEVVHLGAVGRASSETTYEHGVRRAAPRSQCSARVEEEAAVAERRDGDALRVARAARSYRLAPEREADGLERVAEQPRARVRDARGTWRASRRRAPESTATVGSAGKQVVQRDGPACGDRWCRAWGASS